MQKPLVPTVFQYESYQYLPTKRQILFHYQIHFKNSEALRFTEKILLPRASSQKVPVHLLASLHLMLGISYYKLYCPSKIKSPYALTKEQAEFWNTIYRKGLGEFFYRNKIAPTRAPKFPHSKMAKPAPAHFLPTKNRVLLGIGGGKDSIVAGELLKEAGHKATAFVVETQRGSAIADRVIQAMNIPKLVIKRHIDPQLFLDHPGSYNGHIPISAVFAFLGLLATVLYDYAHVIVGNEHSSNFGNLNYKGEVINHQWSKTAEFESMFQTYARRFIVAGPTYFSMLRHLYEIRIVELFAKYKKYFPLFSSCNRSFRIYGKNTETTWCGECAKCVFIFTLLSAFLNPKELFGIFKKNLYEDPALTPLFSDVLGFGKLKPFDCVGTFEETQAALYLARHHHSKTLILKTFLPTIKDPQKLVDMVSKTASAPTLPAHYKLLGIKNVLIAGYGKEGKVTENYLKTHHPHLKIGIADQSQGANYLAAQKNYDLTIKTPGIPKSQITIPHTTATNLFFSQIKNLTIGVTGTKGKSTTTSLIAHLLKAAGKKVELMGNIGVPMLGALGKKIDPKIIFVLELSSYQLDDIHYSPNIAVLLNLFPEHLDHHAGAENYYAAKWNIARYQTADDLLVYNARTPQLKAWAKNHPSATDFNKTKLPKNFVTPLLGQHNQMNIQAAVNVARHLKISDDAIKKALATFKPLPHRLQKIGTYQGITFFDDAISTTPESTIMAIKTLKNIGTIFLGGTDRGYNFTELEKTVRQYGIKNIVLFPDTGKRIFKSEKGLNVLHTKSMKVAVAFAFKYTPKNSICLLSTASPSYSVWKNFEAKGDEFQKWVHKSI